jgi:IclR family pca regulon transcriptional regulator
MSYEESYVMTDTDADMARDSSLFVQSVEKAAGVLSVFTGEQPTLSLSEIARKSGLDMSAAQRFVYTLRVIGLISRDESTRRYRLTPKLLHFGYSYLRSSDLVNRCTPHLLELNNKTSETTNLTVLEGVEIVFVMRLLSRHVANFDTIVGSRLPAYCTAPGLAMLATLNDVAIDKILAKAELKRHTPFTVVDPQLIKNKIIEVRKLGYCIISQEITLGDTSIAAPVIGDDGLAKGAINVAVPTNRWSVDEARSTFSESVVVSAQRSSWRMDWQTRT